VHPWLAPLVATFKRHANADKAVAMRAYMKEHFPFFGIMATERRELVKEHIAVHGAPTLGYLPAIARSAFALPERELHQVAVDLLAKHAKKLTPEHLPLVEDLITTKSWWDSVDGLAVHVVGVILKKHPKEIAKWNRRWIGSDDLWLNRTAIIFQLQWKKDTDQALLFANIERHVTHKDFFIRKAIGWSLRALAESDPEAVKAFVAAHALSPLSAREALRKL
jgi:3-methyladenine DNA glycosylase AlkD